MIQEGFLPKFERFCIGNKPKDAQNIYFEGMLLREGLGKYLLPYGKLLSSLLTVNHRRAYRALVRQVIVGSSGLHSQSCLFSLCTHYQS